MRSASASGVPPPPDGGLRPEAEAEAVGVSTPSFFQHFPQFVLFPMIVVLVAVLIIVFVRSAVETDRPISEILDEIQNGWRKGQAAHELALRTLLMEEKGRKLGDADTRQLSQLVQRTEDPAIREFLLAALGRAGSEPLASEELIRVLNGPAATDAERVHSIRGLGLARSPTAVAPLIAELERWESAERWEGRLYVLQALANTAMSPALDPERRDAILGALRRHVGDGNWTVSWNSALILAADLRDSSGLAVVRRLLDREFVKQKVSAAADQDFFIERAVDALAALADEDSRSAIEGLRKDPSMRVRNAAFRYFDRMRPATSGSLGAGSRPPTVL